MCDTMDRPWGHCAKWNKSDSERQMLYDLTYMWNQENKQTHRISEQTGGCQSQGVGVGKWMKVRL